MSQLAALRRALNTVADARGALQRSADEVTYAMAPLGDPARQVVADAKRAIVDAAAELERHLRRIREATEARRLEERPPSGTMQAVQGHAARTAEILDEGKR